MEDLDWKVGKWRVSVAAYRMRHSVVLNLVPKLPAMQSKSVFDSKSCWQRFSRAQREPLAGRFEVALWFHPRTRSGRDGRGSGWGEPSLGLKVKFRLSCLFLCFAELTTICVA